MKKFLLLLALLASGWVRAQSAAIAFQGQLADGGRPATGVYDFVFRLFNAATAGTEAGPAVTVTGLGVTNGYFTASLDFGLAAYQGGGGRWVQVEVRTGGTSESFTPILPRTAMTPVPFALFALSGNPGPTGPTGPQGIAGATGPQGARGLTFRGTWLTTSNYVADDAVLHNGSLWLAVRANNAVPPVAGADWGRLTQGFDLDQPQTFTNALTATNGANLFLGAFTGNGAGLTNLPVTAVSGMLTASQLPGAVVYSPELSATNAALQTAFQFNLRSLSNDFSARLEATNTALVAGAVLGTNYEAAMATLLVAIPNQILSSNNVHLGSNYFIGPATFAGPMSASPPDETVVPLRINGYFDTNRSGLNVANIITGNFPSTNLFEINTGSISNTLSVDAAGRISLGRNGAPAKAMIHIDADAVNRVTYDTTLMAFDPVKANPDRMAGWGFRHSVGNNPTDPRKNKWWSWGYNNRIGREYRTNEPALFMNMETWWEPWPGASDQDHQMELYWQYSNFENTFGMRPWAFLLRGSNFLHHDIKVDEFALGNVDGSDNVLMQVQTFRAPVTAARMNFTGQIVLKSSSIGSGVYLEDSVLSLSDASKTRSANLAMSGSELLLHAINSDEPGASFRVWGFTNFKVEPRAPTNVTMTVSGVTGHATNLMEFRRQYNTPVVASVNQHGVVAAAGFSAGGNVGITTNVVMAVPGGGSATLVFRNGLLVEVR